MNALKFISRGVWHYKVSYLGVGAGAVLGAAVLLGALIAGDSVKETLRQVAGQRVEQIGRQRDVHGAAVAVHEWWWW